jgi:acyl carrier protein
MENTRQTLIELLALQLMMTNERVEEHANNPVVDLGMDSLDLVELSMAMEDKFGLRFADDEFYGAMTLNDIVAMVDRKKNSQVV